jgi:hypothetical protein
MSISRLLFLGCSYVYAQPAFWLTPPDSSADFHHTL